jgi:uncharacterized protein DUF4333
VTTPTPPEPTPASPAHQPPLIPEMTAAPSGLTSGSPRPADSAIPPAQTDQPASAPRNTGRRRTTMLAFGAGLIIGAAAAFAVGAASLATHLYVSSVTLPRDKVEQQVAEVLQHSYQVAHVTNVSCPERISGGKGTSFVCSYTAAGSRPGKVTVTMLNNQGSLQVQSPST